MRAIALFSGGLDSMLAIKLITLQGIEVTAIFIDVGFGSRDDKSEILKKRANIVGADFEIVDARDNFVKDILFKPKYGYGKNFNPCIDCHLNMIKIAKALLPKFKASFIITGEVIGQRPMSQKKNAINQITKLSNEEKDGIILRPLSAKKMVITTPEKNGWVDREKLLNITGRGRDVQLKLAKEFAFKDYESPSGGCLLTDHFFSNKLKEHIKYDKFALEDIELLKLGRHFRLKNNSKLILGRDERENEKMSKLIHNDYFFIKLEIPSPIALLSKSANYDDKVLASKILLTYTKLNKNQSCQIKIGEEIISESPFLNKDLTKEFFVGI